MINRDNFGTGDFLMSPACFAVFAIPDIDWVKRVMHGALLLACDRNHWTEIGTTPPETAEEIFTAIWDSFECLPSIGGGAVNVGSIYPVAYKNPQVNELVCDGSQYLRTDYPELYAVLDDAFIVDADNFKVPDATYRVIAGSDSSSAGLVFKDIDLKEGTATETLTVNQIPAHHHDMLLRPLSSQSSIAGTGQGATHTGTYNYGKTVTWDEGGGQSHNNIQPTIYLNYMIRANSL